MSWKSNLLAGILVGGSVFALSNIEWNGQTGLTNIKTMYNELFDNYTNSLTNIGTYKKVLQDKQQELKDLDTIRTNLMNENEAQATRIGELEAQIKTLQESGTADSAEIERLEGELQALQTEYENTEADLNALINDYNRVVAELEEANAAVEALEAEIEAKDASITASEVLTEQEIIDEVGGDVVQKLYLYFALAEKSQTGSTMNKTIEALDNLKILDNKRVSPVLLHFQSSTLVYMSSETAFNSMKESATVVTDSAYINEVGKLYFVNNGNNNNSVKIKIDENTTIGITYDPVRWKSVAGYTELDN